MLLFIRDKKISTIKCETFLLISVLSVEKSSYYIILKISYKKTLKMCPNVKNHLSHILHKKAKKLKQYSSFKE